MTFVSMFEKSIKYSITFRTNNFFSIVCSLSYLVNLIYSSHTVFTEQKCNRGKSERAFNDLWSFLKMIVCKNRFPRVSERLQIATNPPSTPPAFGSLIESLAAATDEESRRLLSKFADSAIPAYFP